MIYADIIIPTMKPHAECEKMIDDIKSTRITVGKTIYTGLQGSAAENRNYGLQLADNALVIMVDDDIEGFLKAWDAQLIESLLTSDKCLMSSARLMNRTGQPAYTMIENYDLDVPIIRSKKIPTSAVAFFQKPDIKFDENYIGSGFEDDDFCRQLLKWKPSGYFITTNHCKLIHRNEMKNQGGKYWEHNKKYFQEKWGMNNARN
jgi:hypothetical protein